MAIPPTISFQPGGSGPGTYCNSLQLLFSPWEFNFEFSQLAPEATVEAKPPTEGAPPQAAVTGVEIYKHLISKVVMSPQHTKAVLKVLQENIVEYEAQFGTIPEITQPEGEIG